MASRDKKVLVVGSARVDADPERRRNALRGIQRAGREIGAELAARGYCVVVGSDEEQDVDPYVVEGALGGTRKARVEVHVPLNAPAVYHGNADVHTIPHQFQDWDVTVMDTIEEVDGIIALGGSGGVVHTGLAGWKMGKPVIPVAAFDGGARIMWDYGSATRQKFYRNALSDLDIDQLTSAWGNDSARRVVDSLEAVARRAAFSTSSLPVLIGTVLLTLLAAVGWIVALMVPYLEGIPAKGAPGRVPWVFIGYFCSIGLAGLLGAAMQTLRRVRDGRRLESYRLLLDVVLGAAAGLVTAMLFLAAQVVVKGEIDFDWSTSDYSRIALLSSMASLFASLYLDSALSRFDTVKESVMKGSYEG